MMAVERSSSQNPRYFRSHLLNQICIFSGDFCIVELVLTDSTIAVIESSSSESDFALFGGDRSTFRFQFSFLRTTVRKLFIRLLGTGWKEMYDIVKSAMIKPTEQWNLSKVIVFVFYCIPQPSLWLCKLLKSCLHLKDSIFLHRLLEIYGSIFHTENGTWPRS